MSDAHEMTVRRNGIRGKAMDCGHITAALKKDGTKYCISCGADVTGNNGYMTLMSFPVEEDVAAYQLKSE